MSPMSFLPCLNGLHVLSTLSLCLNNFPYCLVSNVSDVFSPMSQMSGLTHILVLNILFNMDIGWDTVENMVHSDIHTNEITDVHSRQASVPTYMCSLSKDEQWIRSLLACDPQNRTPRRVYILNATWITELHIMELIVWTVDVEMHAEINLYVLFPHLRLTMAWSSKMSFNFSVDWASNLFASWSEPHPTSMGVCIGPLRWLILCAGSLHRMGCPDLCTPICCGRARPHVSPSTDDVDR